MLSFKPISIEEIENILPFTKHLPTKSCDYTPGNLVMWARFMNYRYAIENDTLFISCKSEYDMCSEAFLPPIGNMPLEKSITMLQEYCISNGKALRLTAVPEPQTEEICHILPKHQCMLIENWSDYIYSAQSLATLQGRALNKKRNRYNKFISEFPGHTYSRCRHEDIKEVVRFLAADRDCQHNREDNMRCYEQWQCMATVRNLTQYDQPAGIIRIDGNIVAFTLGEIIGDTLYIHIEKAERDYVGASEAINRYFAADMLDAHPQLAYINREEDLGDPGLQQAKKAYNPIEMLHRYEITE